MELGLLAFSLGPVQEFIAAARTTRDLWTGSYLLSWLTAHALAEVEDQVELIYPSVERNALYAAVKQGGQGGGRHAPDAALLSTLPNTFVARVRNNADPEALALRCRDSVAREWARIEGMVHTALKREWNGEHPGWDERWTEQVVSVWDIRTTILSADEATDEAELRRLLGWEEGDLFTLRMELLGRLAAAGKQIRHYPPDETEPAGAERTHAAGATNPGDPDLRPKDSLLGTWAQMGPRASEKPATQMQRSREFWDAVAGTSIKGTHLNSRDRLSAVSLGKRFAWPVALAPRLGADPRALRFADVHTLAACKWLREAGIDWQALQRQGKWSGYWLRWETREQGVEAGEPLPPEAVWERIRDAKREFGEPSTYYAVLMLDGDRMGERMRDAGVEKRLQISAALGTFAAERVPDVVKEHGGELVYAGGDDVLALLSLRGALACAHGLAARFRTVWEEYDLPEPERATVSAGLVVAHAMEDLRAVLAGAHAAERRAKDAGRNRLAISVRRRSGEHVTVVPDGWALVPKLETLVRTFRGEQPGHTAAAGDPSAPPVSSRWTYTFREQLARLPADPELQWAELARLLRRGERAPAPAELRPLWEAMGAHQPDGGGEARAIRFVQLVQSAAFIARSE